MSYVEAHNQELQQELAMVLLSALKKRRTISRTPADKRIGTLSEHVHADADLATRIHLG